MTAAVVVISSITIAYLSSVVFRCWMQRGRNRLTFCLGQEHRLEARQDTTLSTLERINPAYSFRRYSDNEQMVSRTFPGSVSALAEEAR